MRGLRLLIFHGYLLRGTGSNVYNAQLATALAVAGAEVHLLCQDPAPEELPFVDAVGTWQEGRLRVETLRDPVRCTAYRPDIGGLLPVYVADRYEGMTARTFLECSDEDIERYVSSNVAAVRDVVDAVGPELALANHLVMGPAILARGLGGTVPYAVKVHGSALEYTVKRDPGRFLPWAREGLAGARAVLAGSRHTAESLWAALDDPDLPSRTRLGPPGVDVERFTPRGTQEAGEGIGRLAGRLRELEAKAPAVEAATDADEEPPSAFARDLGAAAAALDRLDPAADRLVAYVGKLLVAKGLDLLAAAWPLVLARHPDARLVVVGFGAFREGLERLLAALADGDLDAVRALAREGRAIEGGPADPPLRHLLAFLDDLEGAADRDEYLAAASRLADRVVLVGRLEHDELVDLLPACEAQVVPSTFPEAFGMVAAEAAACGVLPVSAAHSGLAEVTRELAAALPDEAARHLAFTVGPGAVRELAACVTGWLDAPSEVRVPAREGLVRVARELWSWQGVARTVVHAARGELDEVPPIG